MERFKVLVSDNISQEGIEILKREGDIDVDIKVGIKSDELKKIIGEYDAIITRSGTNIPARCLLPVWMYGKRSHPRATSFLNWKTLLQRHISGRIPWKDMKLWRLLSAIR